MRIPEEVTEGIDNNTGYEIILALPRIAFLGEVYNDTQIKNSFIYHSLDDLDLTFRLLSYGRETAAIEQFQRYFRRAGRSSSTALCREGLRKIWKR